MTEANKKKIEMIFEKTFPNHSAETSLERGQHPWDSLKHIELLNIIEQEFNISLNLNSGLKMKNLASVVQELEKIGIQ